MLRTMQLVLAAGQQRLSDAYGGASIAPPGTLNAAQDIPYRELTFQAEAAACFLGATSAVTTTAYGYTIASGGNKTFGPYDTGPMRLSDFYAVGAGCTLHITGIPF